MKALLPLLAASTVVFAQADPHAAWQHRQTLDVPSAGLVRVELPTGTINASRPRSEDLRLVSPSGIESAYIIEWPQLEALQTKAVAAFRASLRDATTVLELDIGTDKAIRAVILDTNASGFIKAATIEGSNDSAQWQPIAKDEVIFRQRGGQRLRVPFNAAAWKHLRVTINDTRAEAVAFTGASVELEQPATATTAQPLLVQKREELKGHTRLTLPLNATNLWLAKLRVQTTEPVFSRHVQVLANDRVIASSTLFHVALDGHEAAELEVPIHAQVTAQEVVLDIDNGDSPPLKIDGIEAHRYPVALVFHAEGSGQWQLYTGSNAAASPRYDVAALTDQLRNASSITAKVSALIDNPAFDKAATMPETGTAGAAIDLKRWAYSKPIETTERGVLEVALDIESLAHSAPSFSDLRLVQGGHQLPYLLQRTEKTHELSVTFTADPDAKRPSVSRWQLKLPIAALPITRLTLTSSTALFDRSLSLRESRRDSYGNQRTDHLASAAWNQKPGTPTPLHLPVSTRPTRDTLILETDNGDNAPIQLTAVTASHPIVQLRFKTTDTAPIQLYYGNPQASTPRYDLRLVEAELQAATPVFTSLGKEDVLKPDLTNTPDIGKGSPWLWAALALVVGGLLWFIAKLLPTVDPGQG